MCKASCQITYLSLILFFVADLHAATPDSVMAPPLGQRVKVEFKTPMTKHFALVIPYRGNKSRVATGQLLAMNADSVSLALDYPTNQQTTIPMSTVRKVSLQQGHRRLILEGAGVGGFLGLITLGAAVMGDGFQANPDFVRKEPWVKREPITALCVIVGAGAALGAATGWFIKIDRWQELPRDKWTFGLQLKPQNGRGVLALTLKF